MIGVVAELNSQARREQLGVRDHEVDVVLDQEAALGRREIGRDVQHQCIRCRAQAAHILDHTGAGFARLAGHGEHGGGFPVQHQPGEVVARCHRVGNGMQ